MSNSEVEWSDVVIVLQDRLGAPLHDQIMELEQFGLKITDVDDNNRVIEGAIEAARVKQLQNLPCVRYVRDTFNYIAETPQDDAGK